MKWTQLKTHGISCDLKTGRFWDPKSGPLAASFHGCHRDVWCYCRPVGPSTDLLHANLWRWVTPLWHNDADSALGGNSMRVAEVLLSPRLVWLSFKILKKGILRDSRQYGLHMRLYKLTGTLLLNIGCIHWNHTVSSKKWWPWLRMSAKISRIQSRD